MRRTQDEPGLTYSLRSDWILGQGRLKIQAVRNGALENFVSEHAEQLKEGMLAKGLSEEEASKYSRIRFLPMKVGFMGLIYLMQR